MDELKIFTEPEERVRLRKGIRAGQYSKLRVFTNECTVWHILTYRLTFFFFINKNESNLLNDIRTKGSLIAVS